LYRPYREFPDDERAAVGGVRDVVHGGGVRGGGGDGRQEARRPRQRHHFGRRRQGALHYTVFHMKSLGALGVLLDQRLEMGLLRPAHLREDIKR
jgi:hypothetical protein